MKVLIDQMDGEIATKMANGDQFIDLLSLLSSNDELGPFHGKVDLFTGSR